MAMPQLKLNLVEFLGYLFFENVCDMWVVGKGVYLVVPKVIA
jgi:hypothetical protein